MYNHINRIFKIDTLAMRCIYVVDFLTCILCVYMMIYEPNSRALHPFFVAYYSFASGMAGGIDFVGLIVRVVKRHPILLACHIAATSAMILADVIYAFSFGHFWQDGDFYLLYKIFAIVIYLRRYIFLKRLEDLTADEE